MKRSFAFTLDVMNGKKRALSEEQILSAMTYRRKNLEPFVLPVHVGLRCWRPDAGFGPWQMIVDALRKHGYIKGEAWPGKFFRSTKPGTITVEIEEV